MWSVVWMWKFLWRTLCVLWRWLVFTNQLIFVQSVYMNFCYFITSGSYKDDIRVFRSFVCIGIGGWGYKAAASPDFKSNLTIFPYHCVCVCALMCMHACIIMCMYVCVCVRVCVRVCVWTVCVKYVSVCAHVYVCVFVCEHVYVCMYVSVCVRVYVCICVCTYSYCVEEDSYYWD